MSEALPGQALHADVAFCGRSQQRRLIRPFRHAHELVQPVPAPLGCPCGSQFASASGDTIVMRPQSSTSRASCRRESPSMKNHACVGQNSRCRVRGCSGRRLWGQRSEQGSERARTSEHGGGICHVRCACPGGVRAHRVRWLGRRSGLLLAETVDRAWEESIRTRHPKLWARAAGEQS